MMKKTICVLAILVGIVGAVLALMYALPGHTLDGQPTKLIGHRGYSSAYPENTMLAYDGAVQAGFAGIEIDVWESDNGDLMVFHDKKTGRVCQGEKDQIWHVNQDNRKEERYRIPWKGEEWIIPDLQEVLQWAKKHPGILLLHIKSIPDEHDVSDEGVEKIVRLIKDNELEDQVVAFTKEKELLERFAGKGVRIGLLTGKHDMKKMKEIMQWILDNQADTLVLSKMEGVQGRWFGKRLVKYCHKKGVQVGIYTTTTKEEFEYLRSIGVDFAMSDHDLQAQ